MANIIFSVLAAMAVVASASAVMGQQVTCQDAVATLMPCVQFLKGVGPDTPTAPCCLGVQQLNQECARRPDRVKVCQCLKDAAPRFGVVAQRAKDLPTLCSVRLPFQIVRDIDCSKISA